MAESALTSLLFKLASLANEELRLLKVIPDDVEFIKDEVASIIEFLRSAEASKGNELAPRNWVKQLRDVAYDAEDALDEAMMLHFMPRNEDKICLFPRYAFHHLRNVRSRHKIANTMGSIKSKFENISQRNGRYPPGFRAATSNESTSKREDRYNHQEDALFHVKAELVGIEGPKADLITLLVSAENTLKVISVIGMGGLGKSTLVKTVFDDPGIKNHFHYCAWIKFSQTFKIKSLLKDLMHQLLKRNKQPIDLNVDSTKSAALRQKVHEILQEERFLIILDDVWSVNAWNSIKLTFPDNNCSSRIMLTTRIADVAATACQSRDHIYNLKPLTLDESLHLLCIKTFVSKCPDHLEKTFTSILNKCDGLPLAIVAFGGVVHSKAMTGEVEDWELFDSSIDDSLKTISKILMFSYHDLPYHLKFCFLYMSIFPEDHLIERRRLIRLWMAEGFVIHQEGKTLEQVAESYLTELLHRNLVQVADTRSDGRVKSCRIHDLFRDILIEITKEQNFASIAREGSGPWSGKVRRLSMHNSLHDYIPTLNLNKLRSLITIEVRESMSKSSFPQLFSKSFKLLTVLDLQGANLEIFPSPIAKLLNLRYLSLRDTSIMKIPSSIGKLQKLQTLDLKRTGVCKLPIEILNLTQLRNLLVYHYKFDKDVSYLLREPYVPIHSKYGFKAPKGIGCLRSLQKLCFVDASQGNIVKEIQKLNQLQRLGIINLSRENGPGLCSTLKELKNLQALSVTSSKGGVLDLQSLSAPPPHLQRLYLTGKLTSLPEWVPQLENLVKVFLKSSELSEDPLEALEQIPNLVHIELLRAYIGKELHFRVGMFTKLRILGLHELDFLERIIVERGAMEDLETFVIRSCKSLKKVPLGVERLTKLRALDFVNMPPELIETINPPRDEGPDYKMIRHVPEVNSTNLVNGIWEADRLSVAAEGFTKKNNTNSAMKGITDVEDK